MNLKQKTTRSFMREHPKYPANARFYPTDVLRDVISANNSSSEDRAAALYELFERFFLTSDSEIGKTISELFTPCFLRKLCDRCLMLEGCSFERVSSDLELLLDHSTLPQPLIKQLSKRLRGLLVSDGVIPVYQRDTGSSYLIPFSLRKRDCAGVVVKDIDGVKIDQWTNKLNDLAKYSFEVVVDLHFSEESCFVDGGSLALPILMAIFRKEGELPKYSPLRFIGTGAIVGGFLKCVAVDEKQEAISKIENSVFLYPKPLDSITHHSPNIVYLPENLPVEDILPKLQEAAEAYYSCSASYATKRIMQFEHFVNKQNIGDWNTVIHRAKNLRKGFLQDLEAEDYLIGLMTHASVCCHAGKTQMAMKLNAQALEFATKNSAKTPFLIYVALRTRIDQLVIFQDCEKYSDIIKLSENLESEINKLSQKEKPSLLDIDLVMRFSGTLGQAHLYGVLIGIDGMSSDSAKRYLEKALESAKWLRQNAPDEKKDYYLNDIAQDSNYLHLWGVCFDRDYLSKARERSIEIANRLREDTKDEKGFSKNMAFIQRQDGFGAYRELLETGAVQEFPECEYALKDKFWLAATTLKYRGAVLASKNKLSEAYDDFQTALKYIDIGSKDDVLDKIRMTINTEAYRSLRGSLEFQKEANSFKDNALLFFKGRKITPQEECWLTFLKDDSAPFPGLSYGY